MNAKTGEPTSPVATSHNAQLPSYSFGRILASNFPRSVLRNGDALPSSLILRANSGIKRRRWRLTTRRNPQALRGHHINHLRAGHRHLAFLKNLERRLYHAEFLGLEIGFDLELLGFLWCGFGIGGGVGSSRGCVSAGSRVGQVPMPH